MAEAPTPAARDGRHEWWVSVALITAVVLFRASIFVFWERSHFDSDQAITGLMAKHLAEGRAFPVFWYGQSHMLAVESWLAAPLFMAFGTSVPALKLPLLGMNLAIALLLLRGFVREVGLRPLVAVIPALFFALPAAGTAARLVEANGGNVEPFLYALLIWTLRSHPIWCGVVFGLGFLHREFTLYAFLALLTIELFRRDLFTPAGVRRRLLSIGIAAGVWTFVQWVKRFSSGAGPGTSITDVYRPHDNITELASRVCVDPQTTVIGFYKLATEHWPVLFGSLREPLRDFAVVTATSQGAPWAGVLLSGVAVIAAVWIVATRRVRGAVFCAFLLLTALFSITGYVVGRCGAIDFYYMRYELLSVLGMSGLAGCFLASLPPLELRRVWLALVLGWFGLTAVPHARLWAEYLRQPPEDIRRTLIAHLDARGVRYGASRYWVAYAITFLTDERIILKSSDFVRIREYERVVDAHATESIRIERDPCPGGEEIMPRVFLCK